MNHHLDVVEKNLTKLLGDNYEQFYKAFDKFSAIQTDLKVIKDSIKGQKESLNSLKTVQVQSLDRLGQLNMLKLKKIKIKENLRQLLVLKQTVPILQTLISSSGNFSVALDLISNAENVCRTLKLDIGDTISVQLKTLKTDCAKKLESETIKLFQSWLESQIVWSDSPKVAEKAALFVNQ